jgi:hypothetical protein
MDAEKTSMDDQVRFDCRKADKEYWSEAAAMFARRVGVRVSFAEWARRILGEAADAEVDRHVTIPGKKTRK